MKKKSLKSLIVIMFLFGLLYSLISLINHYNFRTYALDLGAYTNALYDYIRFQLNDSTVFQEVKENLLSVHFDLYLILFSPFSLIFKTYTLLIIQIFFILFGGVGVYKYFCLSKKTSSLALYATTYFYLFFGVFSAISFDYHSNVIAASLVSWFFYFLKKRKFVATSFMLLFIIISKENISLWAAFICLGLMFENKKDLYIRNYLTLLFIFCVVYFLVVTSWIMPQLSNNRSYYFLYSFLGQTPLEAILHLIQHPFESIKGLFINHTNHPMGNYVKCELHVLLLVSGLPLLLLKPQYLLMLIPIYFQKLFHDWISMWGIGYHYNIEFAPILAIGIFIVISEFNNKRIMKITATVILLLTLGSTIRTMDKPFIYVDKSRVRFYKIDHYIRNYSVSEVHSRLLEIPKDAIISAQSPFLPHLSIRNTIYQFPIIKDAEYIIYSTMESPYPMESNAFFEKTKALEESNDWAIDYNKDGFTILKKHEL